MKNPWFDYTSIKPAKNKRAVIIGGGIAGSQMAWHLCELDWQVTLIERHEKIANEASGNMAGVISPKMTAKPSPGESFYVDAFHYTLSQLEKLQSTPSGKNIDWNPCGLLQLAHNEREIKRWESLRQRGFEPSFLETLEQDESEKLAGIAIHHKASWFPKAGWINPKSFCYSLISHQNCTVITQTNALSLHQNGNNWLVKDNNKNLIQSAETIIIASGKDIQQFDQSAFLPGIPVRGQTTCAKASKYSKDLKTVLGHEGYLTPSSSSTNNQHIFGATFERITVEKNNDLDEENSKVRLNESANLTNYEQMGKYLSEFAGSLSEIKSSHAAFRFTTPDRYPYVGALPECHFYENHYSDLHQGKHWKTYPSAQYQQGLYVFGGFGSRGLTTTGFCAKLMSQLINGKVEQRYNLLTKSEMNLLNTLHPSRFIIKNKKRGKLSDILV